MNEWLNSKLDRLDSADKGSLEKAAQLQLQETAAQHAAWIQATQQINSNNLAGVGGGQFYITTSNSINARNAAQQLQNISVGPGRYVYHDHNTMQQRIRIDSAYLFRESCLQIANQAFKESARLKAISDDLGNTAEGGLFAQGKCLLRMVVSEANGYETGHGLMSVRIALDGYGGSDGYSVKGVTGTGEHPPSAFGLAARYSSIDQMPTWVQEKIAVLSVMGTADGENIVSVDGVGMCIGNKIFWLETDEVELGNNAGSKS